MSQAYKKTLMNWFRLINLGLVLGLCLLFVTLTSCTHATPQAEVRPITEREFQFEKGIRHLENEEYEKAQPYFLNISVAPTNSADLFQEKALWNLSIIFEKLGQPEKALLTLQQLERLQPAMISLFNIRLAEMKNHFRVSNHYQALEVKRIIDQSRPVMRYTIEEIYIALKDTSNLNYDHLVLEELQFVSEAAKYFVYVMESKKSPMNEEATELLISICNHALSLLNQKALKHEFRVQIAEALLDILRKFEQYKLDDLNLNQKTMAKFSSYAEKKQKIITDWLHQ
ncbi:MAG: hypothetical protein H7061_05540 [Bdellovibrionaceae bacterium]|nr:hypothetical protein [Bdellovibrio sp.]